MEGNPVWEYAARHLEALRTRARELPSTLNYNDLQWTNLALPRQPLLREIVFDHHLLGIGLAWSDVRNVPHSLGPAAQEAFLDAYGLTRPKEQILDEPLALWMRPSAGNCAVNSEESCRIRARARYTLPATRRKP